MAGGEAVSPEPRAEELDPPDDALVIDVGAVAGGTIASLINQLFGRGKEPFWQQAYVNLVRWIIELHRMSPDRWVTLRDVYRCTLDPQRIERKIAEVEALVEPPGTVRVKMADLAPHADGTELAAWSWTPAGDGVLRTATMRLCASS